MTWVVICVVLLAAFGPVLWLMPSRRDRRLATLRARARAEGLVVELRRLPKLDPAPEERVSAGGRVRAPVIECAAYLLTFQRRLAMLSGWRVQRDPREDAGVLPRGWTVTEKPEGREEALALPELLRPVLEALPEDVLALEQSRGGIGAYWLESPGSEPDRVVELARVLRDLEARIVTLDTRLRQRDGADDS